jgi:hypothetical protein
VYIYTYILTQFISEFRKDVVYCIWTSRIQ